MPDEAQSTQSGDVVTDKPELTLDDLCSACGVPLEKISAYVAEGIIEPHGSEHEHWRFSQLSLITVRRASRLERDLGLNTAGVALAIDLMAQIEMLKRRLAHFEQDTSQSNSKE